MSEEARALEQALEMWAARSELVRPSAVILDALGRRPADDRARAVWSRAAGAVTAYRVLHGIGAAERTPLGPRPESPEGSREWDRLHVVIRDSARRLGGRGVGESRDARRDEPERAGGR